jgi:hypothetical protein
MAGQALFLVAVALAAVSAVVCSTDGKVVEGYKFGSDQQSTSHAHPQRLADAFRDRDLTLVRGCRVRQLGEGRLRHQRPDVSNHARLRHRQEVLRGLQPQERRGQDWLHQEPSG